MDWVINLAVKAVKAAGGLVRGLFGGKDEEQPDQAAEPTEPTVDGLETRPTVSIPFTMSGAGHTLTFAQTDEGDVEMLMASRRSLPLRKEFAASHTALDYLRRYITSLEDPTVKELYEEEFEALSEQLPTDLVDRFNVLYQTHFPKGKEEDLSPKQRQQAKQQVQALIREAESLVQRIGSWGDEYDIDGLKTVDINETAQDQGMRLWSKAWRKRESRYKS